MARITYKNIYDLITDAKKQGLIPIEMSLCQDVQTPDYNSTSLPINVERLSQ